MKRRDVIRILEENGGFKFLRDESHSIYVKKGWRPVPVPHKREIDDRLVEKIFKEAGLDKHGNKKNENI
jgi:predicted RNA binding protein YcfA (HicA-like mRNA interferase family)